ncbi:MAG: hypothetical protein LC114_17695 [Bryobacterales bacterium]|nr:hypothetical protein [Bryobacterales bacterium]
MLTQPLHLPKLPVFLERLFADPPPAWVVEFSEQGIFCASTRQPADTRFQALPEGALSASPVENNFRDYEGIRRAFEEIPFSSGSQTRAAGRKDLRTAVLLPDYSARTAILDFEDFPSRREDQEPLVRFRLRKIVPYDIETARIAFQEIPKTGPAGSAGGGVTVVATTCPLHILAEYEALLRERGCHPGFVSTSALCAFSLLSREELCLLAKLSGKVLTAVVSAQGVPRLMRTMELPEISWEEMLKVLQPMFALAVDQLGAPVQRLSLCGFGEGTDALARDFTAEFGVPASELSSRFGKPGGYNAGALGYIQGLTEPLS